MPDRRNSPRSRCHFLCTLEEGGKRYRARVLDVSETGVCLVSPIPLVSESSALQIDIPGNPPVEVEAAAWHQRRVAGSQDRVVWCIGMILTKVGRGFETLVPGSDAGMLGDLATPEHDRADTLVGLDDDLLASLDLDVFYVCVESADQPQRVLTIGAASPDEAGVLARANLEDDWTIVWVREA